MPRYGYSAAPDETRREDEEAQVKHRELTWITAGTLAAFFAVLAIGTPLAAQNHPAKHRHYTLVDVGTFGGPHSQVNFGGYELSRGDCRGRVHVDSRSDLRRRLSVLLLRSPSQVAEERRDRSRHRAGRQQQLRQRDQ